MQEIIDIITTNGIGVASFVALLYFVKIYISKMNDTVNDIATTLSVIKESLITLSSRVDEIENRINK